MSGQGTREREAVSVCTRADRCPVCDKPNLCRMETGEFYKGPCWCFRPTLSGAALRRLLADLSEPCCLCQSCLEAITADPGITWDELVVRSQPPTPPLTILDGDTYQEEDVLVFTAQFHLRRGYCCVSGYRHRPNKSTATTP